MMRYMIKPMLGVLTATLALSVVASAPASAACKLGERGAEHHTLCVEGKQVGTPSKPASTPFVVQQKTGTTQVFSDPGQSWTVTCTSLKSGESPTVESAGEGSVKLASFKLRLEGCKVQLEGKEEPACKVGEIRTSRLTGTFGYPIENLKLVSTLKSEEFMEINITGCVLANSWWVYGSEECSLKQAEVETTVKEFVCEAKRSKMELHHGQGGNVTLALDGNVELAGESKGKKFSFVN